MGRIVVVGGGILGTMHAWSAIERGHEVIHLERESEGRGASVRNFGLIWVSGRSTGAELNMALKARERWGAIGAKCPETGFRASGSITLVNLPEELAVLEEAAARPDAEDRGWQMITAAEIARSQPLLQGRFLGGLRCDTDAIVEPRLALIALRGRMEQSDRYHWLPRRQAVSHRSHGVLDHTGAWHEGDLVVICPGAAHTGIGAEVMAKAPLRRVRIQMLATAPLAGQLGPALADGDSLRYYPAYAGPARERLPAQDPSAAEWFTQLLLVQRLDRTLTIGDTHAYREPFPFDVAEAPYQHLIKLTEAFLGRPVPAVTHRWAGVYSQVTDDSLYFRAQLAPGVVVVTGPGGRGMTMSPAIAEETFQ
ncbi:MAG: TIGR03364 family FAD-dependent oxidoreductase [Candidatus Dormiibacterota bacterium]